MDRRTFLKLTSTGIIAVGGISILNNCSGVERIDFSNEDMSVSGLSDDFSEILYLSSLAPSGHNTQPWSVKILKPSNWIIGSNKEFWLPAVDPDKRETILSIGAFVENLVVVSRHFGYRTDIKVLAQSADEEDILDVTLIKDSPILFSLDKIQKRRTVRKNYSSKEITPADFSFITSNNQSKINFFSKNSLQGKYLSEGTIEANRSQASRADAQEELANWIRWSAKDAEKYRDGLTPESMEISGIAGWYVRNFYSRNSVLEDSFKEKTVDEVIDQVKSAGGWIIITSSDSSVKTLIETGRLFQRMFLKVRDRMIAVHPMTQLLEEKQFKENVAKDLGLDEPVQFILRTGYLGDYPDPVSVRRPVNWFVRNS